MELLHGLDAVCLQKAEQGGALLQSPDFAGTGVRPVSYTHLNIIFVIVSNRVI